ncbi:hypothetical protein [Cytobacillus firmus]|uniref:hypothetical protein n=1 Tax=Cytobacillus firmus TaxID=1399 RepID=UPI0021618C0D|nr:hypothetical protein [Cytobacillus firmus]MCS0654810.1 hypothetical protein [Cytobacillus firmus]
MRELGRYLTYSSPYAYIVKKDGSLTAINDNSTILASLADRVLPMMGITNFTYRDPDQGCHESSFRISKSRAVY